jgi:thiol-disulfide isomerase/thioredoxin
MIGWGRILTVGTLICGPVNAAGTPAPATGAAAPAPAAGSTAPAPKQVLVGPVTRAQVEAAAPSWVKAGIEAKPDAAAARALTAVPPGAEVIVMLGSWCGDSRREISRLWRALDEIDEAALPFTITYTAVDEHKQQPAAAVAAAGLRYVPTLIVRRDGREVGRIVENSPHGVEVDLLTLLEGKASGLLTTNSELLAEGKAAPGAPPSPPSPPPAPPPNGRRR